MAVEDYFLNKRVGKPHYPRGVFDRVDYRRSASIFEKLV